MLSVYRHGSWSLAWRGGVRGQCVALLASWIAACARPATPALVPPPVVEASGRAGGSVPAPDLPPVLAVSGNAPEGEVTYGAVVTLTATCNDREDGPIARVRWSTGEGRSVGEGEALRLMPEPGDWTLLATCVDAGGRATTIAAAPRFRVVDRWTAADSIPIIVSLPFATNRGGNPAARAVVGAFDGAATDSLARGVVTVSIPATELRRAGVAERTGFVRSERGNVAQRDIAQVGFRALEPLDSAGLSALLGARLSAAPVGDVLVYVHGYHTSFAAAAERAARLLGEVQWPGAVVLFSWPSDARLASYRADQADARAAGARLARFLAELHQAAPGRALSIVSHSMGAETLAAALRHLDGTRTTLALGTVALVSPDLAADDFLAEVLPSLRARAARITVYASSADFALWSSWGTNRARRLGLGGRFATVARDVETVEVPYGASDRYGHNPFLAESFRDELHRLLVLRLPASRRGLVPLPLTDGQRMWRLP